MRHLTLTIPVALTCTLLVIGFFGWYTNNQYSGYFHSPQFPLQYVLTTSCAITPTAIESGVCIGSYTYLSLQAGVDFFIWVGAVFGGFVGTGELLISPGWKTKRLVGVSIVGALLFLVFVPVVYTSSFNVCGSPPSYCGRISEYVSLSYVLLATGAVYVTSGGYWIGEAMTA